LLTTSPHSKSDEIQQLMLSIYFALINRSLHVENRRNQLETLLDHPSYIDIYETKAALLAKPKDGIRMVKQLFDKFLDSTNLDDFGHQFSSGLLDFDSSLANPETCNYNRSPLWRERIIGQFVPVYMQYFGKLSSDMLEKRQCLTKFIAPILKLAKPVSIPMTRELNMIIPLFIEALPASTAGSNLQNGDDLSLILDGTLQLLRLTKLDDLPQESLQVFVRSFTEILNHKDRKSNVLITTLNCLQYLGRKVKRERIHPFYASVIQGLTLQSTNPKRPVRRKAAEVRNSWEIVRNR